MVDPREEFLSSTMGAMDLVHNIARRMVPSVEDAQDLVQDTYLAAFAAWVKGRKPDRVEPWLATICLNLARSRYRRDARRPQEVPMEFAQAVADPSDPEREALASLDAAALRRAMWALEGSAADVTATATSPLKPSGLSRRWTPQWIANRFPGRKKSVSWSQKSSLGCDR